MPKGPGKYDELATYVREQAEAGAVFLLVVQGNHGNGFSVQVAAPLMPGGMVELAKYLRLVADEIEREHSS